MTKLPKLPNPGSVLEAKYTKDQMRQYAAKAMAEEREACAKVCDSMPYRAASASKAADAIRARGEA